jgi:succinate-semialdehyde dehydrogenase/glutarate-semialdehyde dehydrogenase
VVEAQADPAVDLVSRLSYVDGGAVQAEPTFDVLNPSTGGFLCAVADAGPDVGRRALGAAWAAQSSWAATPSRTRSEILHRTYELLHDRGERLARLMALEMGKTLADARSEVGYGAEFFRWFAEEAVRISGSYGPAPTGGSRMLTTREAVGPVLAITPWNFPLAMGARKIAPALAAGCTVVIKPAELAPLTTLALAEVLDDAGLPVGVLNVVTTARPSDVVDPLLRDERLRKLTFTGSTAVGRRLIEASAHNVLRVSMELGGNAPFVVLSDADLDLAVEGAVVAKMRNGGQACTAANRFIVNEAVAEEFSLRLAARLAGLLVGPATDEATEVGPLVSDAAAAKVERLVEDAVARGASVLTGGSRVRREGFFFAPTVLTDVRSDSMVLSEEIFGPVAPIVTCADDHEAHALASATPYGLAAYVYSRDLDRAIRFAERLETGMVGINQGTVSNPAAPFGGMKASGLGREGGPTGIDEYLETRYLAIGSA